MMVIMEVMVGMMEVVEELMVVIMEGVGKIKMVMMEGEMVVVMMALVEGVGEADSRSPLGPGLLTPTSGPHKPQRVVSFPCVIHASPHPFSPVLLQSQARNDLHLTWGKPRKQR